MSKRDDVIFIFRDNPVSLDHLSRLFSFYPHNEIPDCIKKIKQQLSSINDDKNLELIELKYIINPDRNDLWEISNLTKFLNRREEEAQYWLHKNDYKPSLMKLLDYRQATTVKQLKQYCRDNQIVGYSKLKKAELKQLIIKSQ